MPWGPRVLVCCVLVACAGDQRLDPSELELRDVLGISPDTAMAWDAGQRASARRVIDGALHEAAPGPVHASLGQEPTLDRKVVDALAAADADREKHRLPAMGVVQLAVDRDDLRATSRSSTLAPRAAAPIELQFAGWSERPGWATLPGRGVDVLTTIASDAGHHTGPIIVTPAPQLAVIAGYLPATSGAPARLVVNPVLLAALEPVARPAVSPRTATGALPRDPVAAAIAIAADGIGNPYTFYNTVGECAVAQQTRCDACLVNSTCTPLTGTGDGNAECKQLAAEPGGRGYSLVCINFALAIDSVASCAATNAPSCPRDSHAANSIAYLDHNADFLDQPECASALDQCLEDHSGASTTSTPPPSPSTSCSDSACEAAPGCDGGDGCDGGSCDDSSGDSGNDGCSSDSGGSSCDSGDSSGCGGDSSSGCSSDSGGDCSGDSGGDCSGGGGNDCNAGSRRHHGESHGYLWACLPLPFALIARRRADRRRARREVVS